jgi:hypothetical protein
MRFCVTLYRQAELRETRLQAEARVRHLKAPPSGIAVRDESVAVQDAQKTLDRATAEMNRTQPILHAQEAIWNIRGKRCPLSWRPSA